MKKSIILDSIKNKEQKILGEGAYSTVYKVFDKRYGKYLALKEMNKKVMNLKELNGLKKEI